VDALLAEQTRDHSGPDVRDWDHAWSQPPVHDLCYALEHLAAFRDDAGCGAALGHLAQLGPRIRWSAEHRPSSKDGLDHASVSSAMPNHATGRSQEAGDAGDPSSHSLKARTLMNRAGSLVPPSA
jgi:hypothetical protein